MPFKPSPAADHAGYLRNKERQAINRAATIKRVRELDAADPGYIWGDLLRNMLEEEG